MDSETLPREVGCRVQPGSSARLVVFALLLAACGGKQGPAPGSDAIRPLLPPGGDSASATAHEIRGEKLLREDPKAAAAHFQWAARLAPERPELLQGWRAALLMQNLRTVSQLLYSSDRDDAVSRLADSLYYESMLQAPLVFRSAEKQVWDAMWDLLAREIARQYRVGVEEARFAMDGYIRDLDPETRGLYYYVNRRWDDALVAYDAALRRARAASRGNIRVQKAHVYGILGRLGQAREEMTAAVESFRERETGEDRPYYESKAMYLHIVGALWEVEGNMEEAEAAYGQAAVEDLSFHPAHLGLARLALAKGDTALADSEYRLAVELRPGDPVVRVRFAQFLADVGHREEAVSNLDAAVASNPWWAFPHRTLGILHEEGGNYQKALESYSAFLDRAPQDHRDRKWAQEKRDLMASKVLGGEG